MDQNSMIKEMQVSFYVFEWSVSTGFICIALRSLKQFLYCRFLMI